MLKLAKDEVIVKDWNYAQTKSAGVKTVANLMVTNKRVVYTAESKRGTSREEVPLSAIKTVTYKNSKLSTATAVAYIVFGILFCCLIYGIPLLIYGIWMLKQASFHMVITTKGLEGTSLEVGVAKIFGKKRKPRIKVKINKAACANIVEEFGAALMEARSLA